MQGAYHKRKFAFRNTLKLIKKDNTKHKPFTYSYNINANAVVIWATSIFEGKIILDTLS
jgi:hypothetical protein